MADLTDQQKHEIVDSGYTILPGVVPPDMVGAALRTINAGLGLGHDPAQLRTFQAQTWCPDRTGDPAIIDLLTRTPALALAESAIGAGQIQPVNYGQIALRFPIDGEAGEIHPHIDGMYSPHNGVPKGQISNFTALVGVYLSDVPTEYAGNFTVWPGSHRKYADYFEREGAEALLRGMPPVDIGEPVQTRPRAGDVVLSHYQIGHSVAPNTSPHVRYAIYFRLHKVGHDAIKREVMTDIWREWDGLRSAL
ncbi:MAG TPA: phytanoyl-CoA dioxygenase family protein [Mycobacteriales bacterium]|nr:phytanoyl-CoA dioxygenase family protein [Mycobacteriales bacterium]